MVSLQQKARREFTHYLGEDVGNSVATAFDFQTNLNEGVIKGGIGALEDIQQLNPLRVAYDFDGAKETWGALADGLLREPDNRDHGPPRRLRTWKGNAPRPGARRGLDA